MKDGDSQGFLNKTCDREVTSGVDFNAIIYHIEMRKRKEIL